MVQIRVVIHMGAHGYGLVTTQFTNEVKKRFVRISNMYLYLAILSSFSVIRRKDLVEMLSKLISLFKQISQSAPISSWCTAIRDYTS